MVITWNENFRKLTTSDQPRTRLVVGIGCGPWRLEMHLLGRAGMASSLCGCSIEEFGSRTCCNIVLP